METKSEILQKVRKVNDYWLAQNPEVGNCAWERGAYFLGDIAAWEMTGEKRYLDYALEWAEANQWNFYKPDEELSYRNADNKICAQSYIRLSEITGNPRCLDRIRAGMERILTDPDATYWWWVDTIYMALPFYYRMGVITGDERYFAKGFSLFQDTRIRRNCYDPQWHLWYRDERFLPGKAATGAGGPLFWGRGNGWVIAGIARTMEIIPEGHAHREEYRQIFADMAAALLPWQQNDGFWRCSITAPTDYDTPETSATVLIAYALQLGIRLGILDRNVFNPAVRKAWRGLNEIAVDADGKIGYVQVVADRPGIVHAEKTNDYAVGTYLLLARELLIQLDSQCDIMI